MPQIIVYTTVSTSSHPKVAAAIITVKNKRPLVSTYSHPKVAAFQNLLPLLIPHQFQHTATRRWLPTVNTFGFRTVMVSTHSRPKAAAKRVWHLARLVAGFNTQPPEGGCLLIWLPFFSFQRFNTQPPEGSCLRNVKYAIVNMCFNTQPPEGGCYLPPLPV